MSRQILSYTDPIAKYLGNELLKLVDNQTFLGITIDNTLSWATQVDNVCQNVTKRITLMKLLSKYIDKTSLNQFYNFYILPILDYGCMVWGHCSVTYSNKLLKLQKRAARIVLRADIMKPSETMFRELNWLLFLQTRTVSHIYLNV